MPIIQAEALERSIGEVLEAAGCPPGPAAIVAESLVLSNLKGTDSHGLIRLAQYVGEIESGRTVPGRKPSVTERDGLIHVDGGWGFGPVGARLAARLAAERARDAGVSLVTLSQVNHVGRLGETVELLAAESCVGIAFCNGGPAGGRVAAFGGRGPLFGTNPLAYAIPNPPEPPIVADFSTAATAEGRVRLAKQNGQRVPDGWIVDADGIPTNDPAKLYEGGAILPAGGHKGYALCLLAEVLGGLIAGAGCASLGADPGNGLALIALHPAPGGVGELAAAVRAAPPAPGTDRVRLPGDPELDTEARRRAEGIPVPDGTWAEYLATAARYGVAVT